MIFLFTISLGEGLTYGNFKNEQDRFNKGLEELGIVDDEKKNLINKINRQINKQSYSVKEEVNKKLNLDKYKLLLAQAKSITSAEDLFQVMHNYKYRDKDFKLK